MNKIDFLPQNTLAYCESDLHKDCPFFKMLNNIGFHCQYIEKFVAYKYFGVGDFDKFVDITNRYCLSENSINCARFKVPDDLLPDGTMRKV